MSDAGVTMAELAAAADVDAKTVERWLNTSRVPHPQARYAVARALGTDEMQLWEAARSTVKYGPDREILAVYPSHAAVPDKVWRDLIGDATERIDLIGYAPYWLSWQVPNFAEILRGKAEAGVRVRVLIGDPDSPLVGADEAATGAPLTLTARIAQTRHLLEPLADVVAVRQSGMGFGRSVYRGDAVATVDWWLHGQNGTDFPVLHLRRRMDGGMFDQVAVRHVESLWDSATPVWETT